ncbi:hypothetical protein QHF85_35735, partial [Polyangium sp. 6x1]|nr:hypothetical protein [Polyangium sp. 6x1]
MTVFIQPCIGQGFCPLAPQSKVFGPAAALDAGDAEPAAGAADAAATADPAGSTGAAAALVSGGGASALGAAAADAAG